jgi:glycosyltransferase involved in cell wall biosynthesis
MKPKLLIVLNYFFPYMSGMSESARHMAYALVDEFEITILTGRHRADLPEDETADGLHVVRASPVLRLHKGYISVDLLVRFAKLAARSDVINLHLPMLEAALLTHIGLRHAPVAISYHCDVTPTGGGLDWLAVKSVLLSARIAAKRADAVVVHTKDYAEQSPVLSGLEDKLIEIPPIIKMERRPLIPIAANTNAFNIGFVGRFVREKGIEVILDAIAPVMERIPIAHFVFIGETRGVAGGSIYSSIASELARHSPHVKLLGLLSEDELWNVYNTLDVLLVPSVNSYEAFGLVQIEAMLAGTLVVASDMRGVRVPVKLTGNGRLVEPGNVASLVEAIVDCTSLRRERSREQVRAHALKHFSNRIARKRFTATLASLIEDSSQVRIFSSN